MARFCFPRVPLPGPWSRLHSPRLHPGVVLHGAIGLRRGWRAVLHRGRVHVHVLHVFMAGHGMLPMCCVVHVYVQVLHAPVARRRSGRNTGGVRSVTHRRMIHAGMRHRCIIAVGDGGRRWRGVRMRPIVGRRTHACCRCGCRCRCGGSCAIGIGSSRRMHMLRTCSTVREQQRQADGLRQRGERRGVHASTRTSRIMPPSMWYSRWQW